MAPQCNAIPGGRWTVLLDRRLRANPAFDLIVCDRLPEAERRRWEALAGDPGIHAILRAAPRSGLGIRAVDRQTAEWFADLQQPRMPTADEADLGRQLARLVADGVLEMESKEETGRFVSGAAAGELFAASGVRERAAIAAAGAAAAAAAETASATLAERSRRALRYGEALARELPGIEPLQLSMRLYGFGHWPVSASWRRLLPDPAAVRGLLGAAAGGAAEPCLRRHWREQPAAPADRWLVWRPAPGSVGASAGAGGDAGAAEEPGASFKLFISPRPVDLAAIFADILEGLASAGAPTFKIAADAGGLLRTDKMVAYYSSWEALAAAASAVAERLRGVPAHGVPFSAEIEGSGGLLSWGIDPPAAAGSSVWRLGGSWRSWLTHRLARALIAAVAAEPSSGGGGGGGGGGGTLAPWRFAVERLRLEDVDADSWTPVVGTRQAQDAPLAAGSSPGPL